MQVKIDRRQYWPAAHSASTQQPLAEGTQALVVALANASHTPDWQLETPPSTVQGPSPAA